MFCTIQYIVRILDPHIFCVLQYKYIKRILFSHYPNPNYMMYHAICSEDLRSSYNLCNII